MSDNTRKELEEGIFDGIKSFFSRGSSSGNNQDTDSGEDIETPAQSGGKQVNIAFDKDGKYPKTGEEAIQDPEVIKLMNLFKRTSKYLF